MLIVVVGIGECSSIQSLGVCQDVPAEAARGRAAAPQHRRRRDQPRAQARRAHHREGESVVAAVFSNGLAPSMYIFRSGNVNALNATGTEARAIQMAFDALVAGAMPPRPRFSVPYEWANSVFYTSIEYLLVLILNKTKRAAIYVFLIFQFWQELKERKWGKGGGSTNMSPGSPDDVSLYARDKVRFFHNKSFYVRYFVDKVPQGVVYGVWLYFLKTYHPFIYWNSAFLPKLLIFLVVLCLYVKFGLFWILLWCTLSTNSSTVLRVGSL